MQNKYKKLLLVTFSLFITVFTYGQGSTSPFSMYGVGNLRYEGFARNRAMGGLSAPLYSPYHLNPSNPASYSALVQNSFIFEVGITASYQVLETPDKKFKDFNGNVSYLSIGFPVTKWWRSGLGLIPMSSIGYDIQQTIETGTDDQKLATIYSGEGGITNFYFDNSFNIFKSLSVGIKLSYLFGPLIYKSTSISYNLNSASTIVRKDQANISAFSYKAGLHYHRKIHEKLFLNIGATYGFNSDLTADNHTLITNTITKTNGNLRDTILDLTQNIGVLEIPQSYSVGTSLRINNKLELGMDYSVAYWSQSKFFDKNYTFADNSKLAFGAEYTPDITSNKYLNLIRYRIGANLSNSYLVYEDTQLKSYEVSMGFGLPIKRSPTLINFALSYQKKYIPGINIVAENYFMFQLNVSLQDIWFKKRVWQ